MKPERQPRRSTCCLAACMQAVPSLARRRPSSLPTLSRQNLPRLVALQDKQGDIFCSFSSSPPHCLHAFIFSISRICRQIAASPRCGTPNLRHRIQPHRICWSRQRTIELANLLNLPLSVAACYLNAKLTGSKTSSSSSSIIRYKYLSSSTIFFTSHHPIDYLSQSSFIQI